ncbi:C2H2-type domain-containing protein [Mycena chlorophos]|uniref:C2H2-type domain-containing protein n=1 Tax=Mycena chlorophos TaxID=658473 RepID=A0A8H6SBC3_MYCCL|nr:C2H2-type domain-containing protein [Mycena chlorophos]
MPIRYNLSRRDIILVLLGAVAVHLLPSSLHHGRQQLVVETVCEQPPPNPIEKTVYRTKTATKIATVFQPTTTTVGVQAAPTAGKAPLDFVASFPETHILSHFPGWTLFRDVYVSNGTFYIVSDQAVSEFPQIPLMISTPLEAINSPENIEARMPTKDTLQFITPAEAVRRWGGNVRRGEKNRVLTVDGNTVLVNEPGQFLGHYYHLCAELLIGVQAMLIGAVTPPSTDGSRDFDLMPKHDLAFPAPPFVDRFIFARTNPNGWRDRPDFNVYFMRAAFPGTTIEEENGWEDRMIMTATGDRAWHFPRLLLTDRSASHRGEICGSRTQRIAAEAVEGMRKQGKLLGVRVGGWWAPVRESILRFAGVPPMDETAMMVHNKALAKPSKIVITYLSRQSTPRRHLTREAHLSLVDALETLVKRKGPNWQLNIVEAERLTKDEQIKLAARTTVLLGVHGNGLTHLISMRPNALSTVIEMFYPGGFTHDYQWPTHALGMRHFAVWNDTWRTEGVGEGKPRVDYPEGFQGDYIPVHGPTVADLIEDRVEGRIAGI